jgi:hypothetical protein
MRECCRILFVDRKIPDWPRRHTVLRHELPARFEEELCLSLSLSVELQKDDGVLIEICVQILLGYPSFPGLFEGLRDEAVPAPGGGSMTESRPLDVVALLGVIGRFIPLLREILPINRSSCANEPRAHDL